MKKKITFACFAKECIVKMETSGRYSTAHLYKNALRSFSDYCKSTGYCKSTDIPFSEINPERLKSYYCYLLVRKKKLNTISTYMRMLRSIYNKGVDRGLATYDGRLFHGVYTGVDISSHKKAIPPQELHHLFYGPTNSPQLFRTQQMAKILFQFSGMSFVDLAYLERSNISDETLEYHRTKTGTKICIDVMPETKSLVNQLERKCGDGCNYVFDILSGINGKHDHAGYIEYQSALRHFNTQLKELAKSLGLKSQVSSYTFRHSWATTARYLGTPIDMISESLGHRSIRTTQIYLKGFSSSRLGEVNMNNCSYIKDAI